MEKYYDEFSTPLLFHKWFWYLVLPLSFIRGVIQLFSIITGPDFGAVSLPDIAYIVIAMALMVLCFIGFFGWKSFAWYSVIILLSLNIAYSLLLVILYALFIPQQIGVQLFNFALYLVYGILVGLYYIKRRELFFLS